MREVELKAVLDSWDDRRARLLRAGATPVFAGRLEDRRYDTEERSLATRDIVLRLRTYRDAEGARAELEFKGPTGYERGYKVREEVGSTVADPEAIALVLSGLGYIVTRAIDREIEQFEVDETLGLPRTAFTSERLTDFAARYEVRTAKRAALSHAELSGNAPVVREL